MIKIMTDEQKREIEEVAVNHHDCIVAFGAELYADGMIRGAVTCGVGLLAIYAVTRMFKKHK